ncbi:MAG TPA: phosphoribosylamine--glycine ligase [Candidatus Omnitrophota bacterium]|nr:phosphoribosylamine--glycine ligase [Candidatus Omnitrophota bacterium]
MKILVVGSGGREHALVWKISQSPLVSEIYAAPGNAGMEKLAECVPISASDIPKLLEFARNQKIDLTVVGPEAPLAGGIVDVFQDKGLLIFGPNQAAARLEGSKIFSKERMARYGIPTASFKIFTDSKSAEDFIAQNVPPFVVKADGLAAGKGVVVALTREEALTAVRQFMNEKILGDSGSKIIIEECLSGEELSVLAFTDGKKIVPLATSQDHKRAFDNDEGPNTGGMGAYSPCPFVEETDLPFLVEQTIAPLIRGLSSEGIEYRGVIYAGLMLTERGPFVLEYNVRFGDPETQAVLARMEDDLLPILKDIAEGHLKTDRLNFKPQASLSVVLASLGYPGSYTAGVLIQGLENAEKEKDVAVFHAGTKKDADGRIVTSGGRVLNVTGLGDSLRDAYERTYRAVKKIQCENLFFRRDIGLRGIQGKSRIRIES